MMTGFSRLFLISMGVIFLLVSILMGLRQLGATREFEMFDHPLLKGKKNFWVIAKGGGFGKHQAYTASAIREAMELSPEIGIELPLHRSKDGVWLVFPRNRLEKMTEGDGPPEIYSWNQLAGLNASFNSLDKKQALDAYRHEGGQLLTLKQAIELTSQRLLVLTFYDPTASYVSEVAALINSFDVGERVIIRSPFTKFMRELRKIEPTWVYGSDFPSISRAVIFDRLKIETLISFSEDVVIAENDIDGVSIFTPSMVSEIKRQKKILLLDLDRDHETDESMGSTTANILNQLDGVLTDDPGWALGKFRPAAAP